MPDSIIKADNISSLSGGGIGFPDGSVSNPSMKFTNDGDTGLYRIGSNTIGIASNGSKVGEIGNGYGGFTGNIIQVAYAELTTSGVTGSAVSIPVDNTIPQNTEGAEILTCSITPKYINSILYIESFSHLAENTNTADSIVAALFKDSQADAICTSINNAAPSGSSPFGGALSFNPIYMQARMIAGSTSSMTFKLRAGAGSPGSAVIRWNGVGSQFFNGTLITYIKIIEVQV
jgi:hypothetical protein